MVHVDGTAVDGTKLPLENVSVFLAPYVEPTANHIPTFGHDAPTGEASGNTDADGNARIDLAGNQKFVARFVANGFDDLYRIVEQAEGTERHLLLTMTPTQTQMVAIPETGNVTIKLGDTSGGSAEPVSLIIDAADLGLGNGSGDAVTGEIEVRYRSWDPAADDPASLPSDLTTVETPLTSFGMFRVEFFQGTERLNVRDGQTIAWEMKVHESLRALAETFDGMEHLNIYSLDTSTGQWIEDTDVSKTYDAVAGIMRTEATHFSTKNLDAPPPFLGRACIDVQVVDQFGTARQASIDIAQRGGGQVGCNQVACDFDNQAGSNFNWSVRAGANVAGVWQVQEQNSVSECDDETGGIGCGLGGCGNVTFVMCNEQGGACNDRTDCCNGLGCFDGECQPCLQASATCGDTNECCGAGTSCTDFQCFAD
jgi:hypothetical protein